MQKTCKMYFIGWHVFITSFHWTITTPHDWIRRWPAVMQRKNILAVVAAHFHWWRNHPVGGQVLNVFACFACFTCFLHVAVSENRIFNWLIYFWTDLHTLGVVRFSYFFFFYFLVWPHKTKILTKWTNGGGRVGTFISFSHSCVVQAKHSHFENICFRNYIICTFCTLTLCTPLLG